MIEDHKTLDLALRAYKELVLAVHRYVAAEKPFWQLHRSMRAALHFLAGHRCLFSAYAKYDVYMTVFDGTSAPKKLKRKMAYLRRHLKLRTHTGIALRRQRLK